MRFGRLQGDNKWRGRVGKQDGRYTHIEYSQYSVSDEVGQTCPRLGTMNTDGRIDGRVIRNRLCIFPTLVHKSAYAKRGQEIDGQISQFVNNASVQILGKDAAKFRFNEAKT